MGLGLMLLAYKLHNIGMNTIPPVTLALLIGQCLLFLGIIDPPWSRYDVCLSGEHILYYKDYWRLVLSAIEHSDDMHLYHNMISLVLKGRTLERLFGSVKFAILTVVFTLATSLTYVGLVWGATEVLENYSYMKQCAIGFSGVLFALKVLTTHLEGGSYRYIHGMAVPAKYAVWIELVIIHVLVPRASFVGHLAGILVGLAYIWGPLKALVEMINAVITGPYSYDRSQRSFGQSYTYMHGTVGPEQNHDRGRQNYGWNFAYDQSEAGASSPYEGGTRSTANISAEELRQRRLQRFQ